MRMVRVAMMSKVNDATANAFGVIPMLCDGDVGMWIGINSGVVLDRESPKQHSTWINFTFWCIFIIALLDRDSSDLTIKSHLLLA